ncbi:MAG TPA: TerB family tellurite resistance protein [Rubrivivax sp.]|nr:TerB family tellurite resistance protein [Rubrivivax sp.]
MRSYPRNSPEAAARIVALVLISDGHVCRSEIEALQQRQVEPELGLAPGAFAQVVHTLCEDLLMGAYGSGSMMCSVDDTTLALLLAEVDEPALRAKVLMLAGVAAEADKHLAEAEAQVVAAMRRQWGRADHLPMARPEVQALQPA